MSAAVSLYSDKSAMCSYLEWLKSFRCNTVIYLLAVNRNYQIRTTLKTAPKTTAKIDVTLPRKTGNCQSIVDVSS